VSCDANEHISSCCYCNDIALIVIEMLSGSLAPEAFCVPIKSCLLCVTSQARYVLCSECLWSEQEQNIGDRRRMILSRSTRVFSARRRSSALRTVVDLAYSDHCTLECIAVMLGFLVSSRV
jgi:hypothetical protein